MQNMTRILDYRRIEVVDEIMVPILRAKTPSERLDMIWNMYRFGRQLAEAGIRYCHPDWDDQQVASERVRRFAHGRT